NILTLPAPVRTHHLQSTAITFLSTTPPTRPKWMVRLATSGFTSNPPTRITASVGRRTSLKAGTERNPIALLFEPKDLLALFRKSQARPEISRLLGAGTDSPLLRL